MRAGTVSAVNQAVLQLTPSIAVGRSGYRRHRAASPSPIETSRGHAIPLRRCSVLFVASIAAACSNNMKAQQRDDVAALLFS